MNLLLKIIEGPNKGAEAALIEDVAVTLGKSDECDIVLADATMPDKVTICANADGVTLDGLPLAPLHLKTLGATVIAVGPADEPWGELIQDEPPVTASAPAEAPADEVAPAPAAADESPKAEAESSSEAAAEKHHSHGWLWCVLIVLVIIALILLGWWKREPLKQYIARFTDKSASVKSAQTEIELAPTLAQLAKKYGLSLEGNTLSGNFATRSERLAVTAEAYSVQPGAELDFSDDESFRSAANDALFVLTEGALKVTQAAERELVITGEIANRDVLEGVLRALAADLPKMRKIDVSAVQFTPLAPSVLAPVVPTPQATPARVVGTPAKRAAQQSAVVMPVCGILTQPYPCLVMQDGRRLFEGAEINGATIVKIEADTITLSDASGRTFTWKP